MSTPTGKRRRVEIPGSIKKKICQMKVDKPKVTIQDLRHKILKENNMDIAKSTIGDILKSSQKWLSLSDDSAEHTRARHAKHEQLEDAVYMWFSDMSSHHAAVNDEMLVEKAKVLGEQLNITDFSYSRGWLQRFKQRRGIKRKLYEGEADSADMNAVRSGRDELQQVLAAYDPDDIFNLDETGLFYRLGPNSTLATTSVKGVKRSKDRITVALTANATGSVKVKPFVIAKVARPRCFGKTYNPESYVRYRSNQKAWMTSALFQDWLKDFNRQMKDAKKHVILLVDNAASHTIGDLVLTNVKLHFLPPNTTAHIQPMDAGIIQSFKVNYRKQLIRKFITCAENEQPQTVDLREALHMVKVAWDTVSSTTINNCFGHVRILPPQDDPEDNIPLSELRDSEEDLPLSELRDLLNQLQSPEEKLSAEEFVNVDSEESTGQQLSDDDILTIVSREEVLENADDESCDASDPVREDVTSKEARQCISTLISYFEQSTSFCSTDDTRTNTDALDFLWKLSGVVNERTVRDSKQTKMTDYFK